MKITVCDVCFHEDGKQVKSQWRLTARDGKGQSIRLDACDNHKGFFKGNSFEVNEKKYDKLMYGIEGGES